MIRVLILAEAVYCGWLVWAKVLLGHAALPVDRIPLALVICAVIHLLMALVYLLRYDTPGTIYSSSAVAVYGLYSYLASAGGMMLVFIFGGAGFIAIGLVMLAVYLSK